MMNTPVSVHNACGLHAQPCPAYSQKKLDLRVLYYAQYAYYEKKAQAGGVVRLSLCAKLIKGKMKK